jgi:hypothetical protein
MVMEQAIDRTDGRPDTPLAVSTTGLTKRFGDRTVVQDVALAIGAGSVCGFVGPNGAGKPVTELRHSLPLNRRSASNPDGASLGPTGPEAGDRVAGLGVADPFEHAVQHRNARLVRLWWRRTGAGVGGMPLLCSARPSGNRV